MQELDLSYDSYIRAGGIYFAKIKGDEYDFTVVKTNNNN